MITDFWEVLGDGHESAAACLPTELMISEGSLSVERGQKFCDGVYEKAYQ